MAVQILALLLWALTWPPSPPMELSFVVPQDEVIPWQAVVTGFEQSHPDIHIHLVTDPETGYTTDQREAIYTADFQAEMAQYDLVYMDIVWPLQFADRLQDLMPYVERDGVELSGFLDSELAAGRLGDGLYRLPMRADVGVLYYRQDLLQALGLSVPTSLEELAQVVQQLKAADASTAGYVWQGSRYEGLVANFVEVMASLGATWIDPATDQVGLADPAAIAAATVLQDLIQQGISPDEVIAYTEKESLQRFMAGQTVFLRGWPYFWTLMQRSNLKKKVAIAPPFSYTKGQGAGCRGGWGFGIPKNATHGEAAWEAIKYFTSAPAQKQFVLASGYLPSRPALFQDPDIVAQYPQMPQLFAYLENASVFRPLIKDYGAASEILQNALGDILQGRQSVEAAMEQAQSETETLLMPKSRGG